MAGRDRKTLSLTMSLLSSSYLLIVSHRHNEDVNNSTFLGRRTDMSLQEIEDVCQIDSGVREELRR